MMRNDAPHQLMLAKITNRILLGRLIQLPFFARHPALVSGSIVPRPLKARGERWMLKQVQHDEVLDS
ncbi:MAG: hypothetical protein B7Y89_15275 [Novosphingobium sp. 32-60-15]|nr:MAG: hypothetical protein B7Y89_15275 [Novosphingobium sp. 32-60-15]